MKEVITTLIFAGIFIATIFFVQSCQPTRQQCDALYPRDINAVNAANAQKMGDEKVAAQKSIDYVKLICVVGCVASIAAIVLGTATLQGLGWSGLAICLASIALIQFYTTWPQWFAYGGGAIALGAGGYAIWKHKAALVQVVTNVEKIKLDSSANVRAPIETVKTTLQNQSAATKSLVASIRAKL